MKKIQATSLLLLAALLGVGQNKLLVTDFAFLNTFSTPTDVNISNHFTGNSEMLEKSKSQLLSILQKKYDLNDLSFHPNSISFVDSESKTNPSKSYKENHKTLAKQGGFDYYLLVTSYISPVNRLNHNEGYTFDFQVKLSDKKGKKIFNNSIEIPFTSLFRDDRISTSELVVGEDFYKLYETAIATAFSGDRAKVDQLNFYRSGDSQFEDFVAESRRYQIKKFMAKSPILLDAEGSEVTLRVKSGNDTDIDISNASGEIPLVGGLNDPIAVGIRNPQVQENWVGFFQHQVNNDFGDLDMAPSASVFLRIGSQPPINFKLINGRLTGKIESKVYMVSYEPDASLLRIFVDQKLVALSQPLEMGEGQDLKVYFKGSDSDLPKAINLHQIYFQAMNSLRQKIGN